MMKKAYMLFFKIFFFATSGSFMIVANEFGRTEMLFFVTSLPDMEVVKKFTPPESQAKNFTPLISPIFNTFGHKNTNK